MAATAVKWDLRKLQKCLENQSPGLLYLIYGDEDYLIDQTIQLIKKKTLSNDTEDFCYDQFYYPENHPSQVRDAVETLTMLSPRRLVLYKILGSLKDKEWEELFPILQDPVPTTTFVISLGKVDQRKKYFRMFSSRGFVVELKRPYDRQVGLWIDYIVDSHDLEIHPSARVLLHQLVGNNLQEINNEVLKIKQYLGDTQRIITEKEVLNLVSRSRLESVFDLTKAIGQKNLTQALICLVNLLEQGQSEIGVLSLIARHIRILRSIYEGLKQGLSGVHLSSKIGVPLFFLQEYLNQSQSWSISQINQTLMALHETDKALKTSPLSSRIWLENFILQVCM